MRIQNHLKRNHLKYLSFRFAGKTSLSYNENTEMLILSILSQVLDLIYEYAADFFFFNVCLCSFHPSSFINQAYGFWCFGLFSCKKKNQ